MHRDALIQKRLDELLTKGKAIIAAQTSKVANPHSGRRTEHISHSDGLQWITSVSSILKQAFGFESVHFIAFQNLVPNYTDYLTMFQHFMAVFLAAKEDYEGGYLFNLRGLIKAEVLTDALEQAEELLNRGYKDPSCVLTGISLEIAIKDLIQRHGLPTGKLDKMNVDLCKASVYNVAKQKQITAWADLRNKAAHGDWNGYSDADVQDMLSGVRRFLADFL